MAARIVSSEELEQWFDIFRAFPQRRHVDENLIQEIVEIASKIAAVHSVEQSYGGGADDAHVWPSAREKMHQPSLKVGRKRIELLEKQCSAVGERQCPACPTAISKYLGLELALLGMSAADIYERSMAADATPMNDLRNTPFADAGLAHKHHARVDI